MNVSEPNQNAMTPSVISRNRLECLFDGIFAIAMTILVLELKVPDLADPHSAVEMGRKMAVYAPVFGSYVLSFVVLGLFWFRHNEQFHHCQFITNRMLVFQLVQLAMAAFFPFCAALLGRYPANSLSSVFYSGCVFIYLWAVWANWLVAKNAGALKPEALAGQYGRIRQRLRRSCLVITLLFGYTVFKLFAQ